MTRIGRIFAESDPQIAQIAQNRLEVARRRHLAPAKPSGGFSLIVSSQSLAM